MVAMAETAATAEMGRRAIAMPPCCWCLAVAKQFGTHPGKGRVEARGRSTQSGLAPRAPTHIAWKDGQLSESYVLIGRQRGSNQRRVWAEEQIAIARRRR
jgi:hypothetical protein